MHNPFVPETLEGWSVLHLMYRVRWDRLRRCSSADREQLADEAVRALAVPDAGSTAFVQVLGHKADLMFICFRRGFEQLAQAQLALSRDRAARRARADVILRLDRGARDVRDDREDPRAARREVQARQRRIREGVRRRDGDAASARHEPAVSRLPKARYVCFYPMNKRRGETLNWYAEAFERRASMMREHGMIGRTTPAR